MVVAVENVRNSNPQVFESVNGGSSWADITGAGSPIDNTYNGQAATFLSQGGNSFLVVGTSAGVYLRLNNEWAALATGLPTVPIFGMTYTSEDDRLVIATLGRGVWFLPGAFNTANTIACGVFDFSPIDDIPEPLVSVSVVLPDGMETYPPDDYDETFGC